MSLDSHKVYFFGRLNLIANYIDKKDYLWLGFKPSISLEDRDAKWSFFEREQIEFDSNHYIHGYLVKYRDDSQEIVLPEEGEFDEQKVENQIIVKIRFFIQINSGIIAYSFTSGRPPSDKKFKDIFCRLFEKSHDNLLVSAEIQAVEANYEIFEEIRGMDFVESVEFTLHPSNPFSRDIWKEVDDDIRDMNAATYKEKYSAKPNQSLNVNNIKNDNKPNTILGKFQMALDGYGFGKIKGKSQGQDKTITTGRNPVTTEISETEETMNVFEQLYQKFKEIKDSFGWGIDKWVAINQQKNTNLLNLY